MSFSVFTSCALNYLPKARALAESLRRHQPDARLTLCLCDLPPPWLDLSQEPFDRIWFPEDLGYDRAWIFQHNVMELCTAVKGRALCRLLEEDDADLTVYLDPDVYLLNPIAPLHDMMSGASIGLVPHILAPESTDLGVRMTEMSVTAHGIYNLGHLAVRPDNNGRAFAAWWAERLDAYCYDDRLNGLFTDQRWVDLAPTIFDGVRILRTPALDVASWNLSGRAISQTQPGDMSAFSVNGVPLMTYHFSGTGPAGTHRRVRETFAPCNAAAAEIERHYEETIARHGQAEWSERRCGYDVFDNGRPVTSAVRQMYRDHADLRRAFRDPYACPSGGASLFDWLAGHRPGMVDGLQIARHALAQAFEDLFDAEYYLATYPEAQAAVSDGVFACAMDHYCAIGSRLFFDPNAFFVSSYYHDRAAKITAAFDTTAAGGREDTLLWHYLSKGLANGLEPIEFFDSRWYLAKNPDVEAAMRTGGVSTPLAHFLLFGSNEGRDPGPGFTGSGYLRRVPKANAALAESGKGPFGAFVKLGGVSGRVHVAP